MTPVCPPVRRASARPAGRSYPAHRGDVQGRRGVVIVITILGLIMLSSMVFYVFNTGRHVQMKIETQNAADASAQTGAGWVARSLNGMAMGNVELSRLSALVNVMDAMPLAVDISITTADEPFMNDVTAQWLAANHALERDDLPEIVERELKRTADRLGEPGVVVDASIDTQLRAMDQLYKQNPNMTAAMTHFRSPTGQPGAIWRAMSAVDQLNVAYALSLPATAQRAASEAGLTNMLAREGQTQVDAEAASASERPGKLAMMWPIDPSFPVARGTFRDLGHTVRAGIIPPEGLEYDKARYFTLEQITFYEVVEPGYSDVPRGIWLDRTERGAAARDDEVKREAEIQRLIAEGFIDERDDAGPFLLPPFATTVQQWAQDVRLSENEVQAIIARVSEEGEDSLRRNLEFIDGLEVHRRGPFDTVFGFRYINQRPPGSVRGDPPGWSDGESEPTHYSTFGMQDWLTFHINRSWHDQLRNHLREIARIKHGYIWPEKRNEADPDTLLDVVMSDWEVDVERDDERSQHPSVDRFVNGDRDTDRYRIVRPEGTQEPLDPASTTVYEFAEDNPDVISQTMFLVLDIYHAKEDSAFDPALQWRGEFRDFSKLPNWYIRGGGWRVLTNPSSPNRPRYRAAVRFADPQARPPVGRMRKTYSPPSPFPRYPENYSYEKIGADRHLFVERCSFQTNPEVEQGTYALGAYPELGFIKPQITGEPETFQYFRTRYFLLVGVNVGPRVIVSDPYIGFDPTSSDAPAPLAFTTDIGTPEEANRNRLTFLAAAKQANRPSLGESIFTRNAQNPYPGMVGLAQARVFNSHSFDLWTQMWTTQLQGIEDLESMRLTTDVTGPGGSAATLDPEEVTALVDYLNAITPLAQEGMHH